MSTALDDAVAQLDMGQIETQARMEWMRSDDRPRRDIEDWLMDTRFVLSWASFIAMAVLSASHTIRAFSYNVEGWPAYAAPVAFELFLIATTLRSRHEAVERWNSAAALTKAALVVVAILANGISGVAVAYSTATGWQQSAYMLFALPAAVIVPLATIALGDNLSSLMRARSGVNKLAREWQLVAADRMRRAIYAKLIKTAGVRSRDAATRANELAVQFTTGARPVVQSVRTALEAGHGGQFNTDDPDETRRSPAVHPRPSVSKIDQAVQFLRENPHEINTSVRALEANGLNISKTTWSDAQKAIRAEVQESD